MNFEDDMNKEAEKYRNSVKGRSSHLSKGFKKGATWSKEYHMKRIESLSSLVKGLQKQIYDIRRVVNSFPDLD